MEDDLKTKLERQIEHELDAMYLSKPEEPGYAVATERVAKLYKLKIEGDQAECESQLKTQQAAEATNDRWIKFGLEAAGIVLPLCFYGIWMWVGFKFEETGAITSPVFKGLVNKFRPTK